MTAAKPIDSWPNKLAKLRDFVAAKKGSGYVRLERATPQNSPWTVTLTIGDDSWTFPLVTSEILELRTLLDLGELDISELFTPGREP